MIALLLVGTALAGETSEEVFVFSEMLAEQARQKVEDELKAAGYDRKIKRRDGRVIYRHDAAYLGQLVVGEDGWVVFERQPIQVRAPELPFAEEGSPLAWAGCVLVWRCVKLGGQLVSKRRFNAFEREMVAHVYDDVQVWNERMSDVALERKLQGLPDQLERLWVYGVPLEGGGLLLTPEDRRAALLAFWGSRTDTPWGREVQEAVAAFCRAVVQQSEDPFTQEEIDAFNRSGVAVRTFSLARDTLSSAP